jgi:hypothetical protein
VLTQADLTAELSYDPGAGVFCRRVAAPYAKAGPVGTVNNMGYVVVRAGGKLHLAHRLAWLYVTGLWPRAVIDHINGDKSDNRLANLREATHAENLINAKIHANNRSGLKGVAWNKSCKRWGAYIGYGGKSRYLGVYKTKEEAHEAYLTASRALYGEFTRAA